MKKIFFVIFLLHFSLIINSQSINEKLYANVPGSYCFRRLNGTHQVGCSSKFSGSSGVIHIISSKADIDFIVKNPLSPPYVAVLPPYLFTRDNLLRIRDEGGKNVSGILLINIPDQMKSFSLESKCPNQFSSIRTQLCDNKHPESIWNPYGSGILLENFIFPIYYISHNETITKIKNCFEKFNNFDKENQAKRSLCSIEISTPMAASKNSAFCIERMTPAALMFSRTTYCEPLNGKSVFATLFPRPYIKDAQPKQVDPKEKIILLTTRIDTTSMFADIGLGAADSLVSFATLLNIAHVLKKILHEKNLSPNKKNYNMMFMFFNGESFDYIGSQRLLYDLHKLSFPQDAHHRPLSIDQIDFMLDIGTLDDLTNVKLITASQIPQANTFLLLLNKYNHQFGFNINFNFKDTLYLPPTSAQSFLRENLSFPVAILNSKAKNMFYHSIYDDASNIRYKYANKSEVFDFSDLMDLKKASELFEINSIQMKIRNMSSVVACALYELLTDMEYFDSDYAFANPILIDEFLHCFLESADCPLYKAASYPNSPRGAPVPPSRYVSVGRGFHDTPVWTYRILGYLISDKHKIPKENCTTSRFSYFAGYNNTGECRLTTQNYTDSLSPAFLEPDYDWSSGKYSTWTESTWTHASARLYIRPSRIKETLILTIGFIVLILSFVIVFLVSSRSEILFENVPISSLQREPAAC